MEGIDVITIKGRVVPAHIGEAVAQALYERGQETGWKNVSLITPADGAVAFLAALDALGNGE